MPFSVLLAARGSAGPPQGHAEQENDLPGGDLELDRLSMRCGAVGKEVLLSPVNFACWNI